MLYLTLFDNQIDSYQVTHLLYNKPYTSKYRCTAVISMALTELMVKQARGKEKPYTMSDGKGLILETRPNGKKYWIIRYWVDGKEKRTSVGSYPAVSLKEAREKNQAIRNSLASGKPVGADSEAFADIVKEWLEKRVVPKFTEGHVRTINLRLKKYILPRLGAMRLNEITSGNILQLCRKIEESGNVETASRVKQIIGQVFRYAIATDRIETDPTDALKGALQTRRERHHASIIEPDKIGVLIRQIEAYPSPVVRCALKFSALTFCRPGEIRHAEWKEIDIEKAEWKIPAEKMKMKRPHIIPLSRQALGVLEDLRDYSGNEKWLFPSSRKDGRPMSENTIRVALRAMGYGNGDMTAQGFRSMASTNLNEQGWPPDVIERQLAHVEGNSVRASYNYAEYLPQRREMMKAWADWLDGLK